jgi:hypothetical protein
MKCYQQNRNTLERCQKLRSWTCMCIHVVGNEELGTLSNRNCYCVAIGTGTQSFTDTHYTSPCDHLRYTLSTTNRKSRKPWSHQQIFHLAVACKGCPIRRITWPQKEWTRPHRSPCWSVGWPGYKCPVRSVSVLLKSLCKVLCTGLEHVAL